MQTPVDNYGNFTKVSKSTQASLALIGASRKEALARAKLPLG